MRLSFSCSLAAACTTAILTLPVVAGSAPPGDLSGIEAGRAPAPFRVEVVGSGPPMLFIPGLASSGAVWERAVAHFKGRYECHVLTLAGFAGEPPVEGPFLETMRQGIARYIRAKKLERPVLVGHSLGAYLVFSLGASEPDLVGPLIAVDGLPCGPAAIRPNLTPEELKQGEQIGRFLTSARREDFLKQQRAMLQMWITDPGQVDLAARWAESSDQGTVGKAMGELWSRDLRPEVVKIKAAVLLIGAAPGGSGEVPAEEMKQRYRAQVEKIQDRTVVFAAKARHFIMFDEPDWLNRQIDEFLAARRGKQN
jgi:N-formylmaleamate deformylase